jgi:ferric iron reductase protein FhuF
VAVLREVSVLGGFFTLDTGVPRPSWVPMNTLIDGSGALAAAIDRTAAALAAQSVTTPEQIERRVAASIMQQGLIARLISPGLACAVSAGTVPRMQLARMWWDPTGPSPVPITLPDPHDRSATTAEELAQLISMLVIDEAISGLVRAIEEETRLSPHISWGNVASAVVGATTMLARQVPAQADRAADVCREVLGTKHLAEAGDFESSGQFRRNSCCLYYRLPRGGLCGDCALAA